MSWEDEDDWEKEAGSDDDKNTGGGGDMWDGEDEDEGTELGDTWDADDKEKKTAAPVVPGTKRLTKRQLVKKVEAEEAERAAARLALLNLSDEDKQKMKEEERRQIERDIVKGASDLFGDVGELAIPEDPDVDPDNSDMNAALDASTIAACKKEEPKGVDDVKLVKQDDFNKFAQQVADKVAKSVSTKKKGDTKKLVEFLKIMCTTVTGPMDLDEANEVKKHFNKLYNTKAKDPSKKKKVKGKTVKMSRDDAYDDRGGHDDYADYY